MNRRSLAGTMEIAVEAAGAPVDGNHLVGVSVAGLRIDTRHFRSRDLKRKREGLVAVSIAGQESVFSFSGKGLLELSCDSQIGFLGANPGCLPVDLRVVEIDAATRQAFERGGKIADMASKAVAATNLPFAELGFGAAASLLSLLARLTTDDDEVAAFTVVDEALVDGARVALHIGGTPESPKVCLVLRVHDFGRRETFNMVAVRLVEPWIEFADRRLSERVKSPTGKGSRRRTYTVEEWLTRSKGLKTFRFAAASGRHRAAVACPFSGISDIVHWRRWELFRVAAARAADRHLVPVSLNLALHSEDGNARATMDAIRASLQLAAEINPDLTPASDVVRKAGRSFADLLGELSSTELPLFQFDGALLLLPPGRQAAETIAGGKIELARQGEGLWRAKVVREFEKWRKKPLGRIGFEIEVVTL